MRISCWARGRLHCFCSSYLLSLALKTHCRKMERIVVAYRFDCCNCGKTKYYNSQFRQSDYRINKFQINWPRTAELALQGEREND